MAELQAEKDALEDQRKQSEAMMAQLLEMQKQMAQQNQSTAPPAQDGAAQPDVAAMMAELQALRAQVAAKTQPAPPDAPERPQFEDIMQEFGEGEENKV